MCRDVNRNIIAILISRQSYTNHIFACRARRADWSSGYLREIVDRWCETRLDDCWQDASDAIFAEEGSGATGGDADEHHAQHAADDTPGPDLALRFVAR